VNLPASLSGTVFNGTQGGVISGVQLSLSLVVNGQSVFVASTATGDDGTYSFSVQSPGTYIVTQTPPAPPSGFLSESTVPSPGTVNGTTDGSAPSTGDEIYDILLAFGNNGLKYNFTDYFAGS
jgi:hypothetical protein